MPTIRRLVCCVLVLACLMMVSPTGLALTAAELPEELFLYQQASGTCTLCSATMMIRSMLYINGHPQWSSVTEAGLKPMAWVRGVGLRWNFTYTLEDTTIEVAHSHVNGFTEESLIALLEEHPEGIVFYCGNVPHAVFLTHYEDGVFYCAETVEVYSGESISLEDSWIGTKYGSQARILANATAYWYIASYETYDPNACGCSGSYAGTYVVTTSSELMIRGGHGTSYAVLGYIPSGAKVTVHAASGESDSDWAHVTYDGMTGYSSMRYLRCVEHAEETPFEDVASSAYYSDAVAWAYENGITTGWSDYTFRPDETCTRDQVVTFLWRAAGKPAATAAAMTFQDVSPEHFCYDAAGWAVEKGVTTGLSQTQFGPQVSCTREQVVTFLWRYFGCPEPTISNPFTDVANGQYYTKAVLWAYENGITTGLNDTTFNPTGVCTRAEIVTFLYRAMQQ